MTVTTAGQAFPAVGLVIPAVLIVISFALVEPVGKLVKLLFGLDHFPNLNLLWLAVIASLTLVLLRSIYFGVVSLVRDRESRIVANVAALLFGGVGAVFGSLLSFAIYVWL
jgi:hypothetical protein